MTEIEVIEHTANDEEMEDQIGTLHDVVIHRDNSTEPEAAHYMLCVVFPISRQTIGERYPHDSIHGQKDLSAI